MPARGVATRFLPLRPLVKGMRNDREKDGSIEERQNTNRSDDQARKLRPDGTTVDQTGAPSTQHGVDQALHTDPNRMGTPERSNPDGPKRPSEKTEKR